MLMPYYFQCLSTNSEVKKTNLNQHKKLLNRWIRYWLLIHFIKFFMNRRADATVSRDLLNKKSHRDRLKYRQRMIQQCGFPFSRLTSSAWTTWSSTMSSSSGSVSSTSYLNRWSAGLNFDPYKYGGLLSQRAKPFCHFGGNKNYRYRYLPFLIKYFQP